MSAVFGFAACEICMSLRWSSVTFLSQITLDDWIMELRSDHDIEH